MSHIVRIKAGLSNIQLPDGQSYKGGDIVTLTDDQYAQLSTAAKPNADGSYSLGDEVIDEGQLFLVPGASKLYYAALSVKLASVANGEVARFKPGWAGTVYAWKAVVTTAVTTASKTATFNLDIAGTDVGTTPSTLVVTSATATPVGKEIAGAAVSGANTFTGSQEIKLEAASVTAFAEGFVTFYLTLVQS